MRHEKDAFDAQANSEINPDQIDKDIGMTFRPSFDFLNFHKNLSFLVACRRRADRPKWEKRRRAIPAPLILLIRRLAEPFCSLKSADRGSPSRSACGEKGRPL